MHGALLPDADVEGKAYIEHVEKSGHYSDLPLDWIVSATSKVWGADKRP